MTDLPNPLSLPVYSTDEATRLMEGAIQEYDGRLDGRVRAWAMPFSADYCTPELLVAAKELADRHETGVTLHHNTEPAAANTGGMDPEQSMREHGGLPTEYLEEIGFLGPNTLLSHLRGISDGELDCLTRTSAKVVVCPTAAIKGGTGRTNTGLLPEMLNRGICVGLGTDAGNNSNLVETMRSMYLVAVLYKDARQDTGVVPAETALEMATIQGARAMGLDDEIGSIEVGKKADLVIFDTMRPEWRTIFNPVNTLVYGADGRSVHTVIVDGRVVVDAYRPVFVDERRLIHKVQEIGESMISRTGVSFPPRWPLV